MKHEGREGEREREGGKESGREERGLCVRKKSLCQSEPVSLRGNFVEKNTVFSVKLD